MSSSDKSLGSGGAPQASTDKSILQYLNKRGYRNPGDDYATSGMTTNTTSQGAGSNSSTTGVSTTNNVLDTTLLEMTAEQESQVGPGYFTATATAAGLGLGSTTVNRGNVADVPGNGTLATYEKEYQAVEKWILNSLDIYKNELMTLLYPLFVHSFLDLMAKNLPKEARWFFGEHGRDFEEEHRDELAKLAQIYDFVHLKENNVAQLFRGNKYQLRLTVYSFELFITFLNENRLITLTKIVNQHLHILVLQGRATMGSKDANAGEEAIGAGLVATSGLGGVVALTPLGLAPPLGGGKVEDEIWRQLKADLALSLKGEAVAELVAELRHVAYQTPIPGTSNNTTTTTTTASTTTSTTSGSSSLALPELDIETELRKLKELSKRLASYDTVCCYTLLHTYGRCSTLCISDETFEGARYLGVGFADSYIQVWSMLPNHGLPRMKPSSEFALVDYDTVPELGSLMLESTPATASDRRPELALRLVGHSGPVTALAFMPPFSRLLMSASQDATLRLWSLDTRTPVCVYKGHEGPIWCLAVASRGYYFASGGWDRVARIWTTDAPAPVRLLVGHLSDVTLVAWHPNGSLLATGSADCTVRVWDVLTGVTVRLARFTLEPSALIVSPDGRFLVVAIQREVVIYDLASGRCITAVPASSLERKRLLVHKQRIVALAFPYALHPSTFVATSLDGVVSYWTFKDNLLTYPNVAFKTKNTPLLDAKFTYRNLLLVAGPN